MAPVCRHRQSTHEFVSDPWAIATIHYRYFLNTCSICSIETGHAKFGDFALEMHQVRYLLAVSAQFNFTRAAEACNVSQPSLTRAIKYLEMEMGGELFYRERNKTRLSELGRMVHPHLQQVFDQAAQAKCVAKDFKQIKRIKLRLGIMCTISPKMLTGLIGGLNRRHPNIELDIRDSNARKIDKELLDGELDAAIYCLPGQKPNKLVHTMPLFRERMMIVVPRGHRFAKRENVPLQELNGEKYITRTSCEFNGYADRFFEEKGVDCPEVFSSDRDDWILAMIRSGLGFGFMPEYTVTGPNLVARPAANPAFWREVNLATVRGRNTPQRSALWCARRCW
jgi:DNA-binding transcriptional LysR family regulator